ncbi:glycosyltransferase family 2 protein [Paenibacillus sp. SI8]|uniref:glycosyltransferase family 2 protein n=1 Tax=unclassified Paenibacillus TaxID=185978 RepID=UPI00346704B9
MKPIIKKQIARPKSMKVENHPSKHKRSSRQTAVKSSLASSRSERHWKRWGVQAGQEDARHHSIANMPYHKKALNTIWNGRDMSSLPSPGSRHYQAAASGYVKGYCRAAGMYEADWVMMPTTKSVGAIVSVMNEETTIVKVLEQLNRLPLDEIIIIVNGSNDQTLEQVRAHSHALIVKYPEPLGHDVGRAVGAKLSHADIVLFLDGDFVVRAENLLPFIYAIDRGSDLALNDITPFLPPFSKWDSVTVMKRFLNMSLKRPDLNANSLTAVPHALSRNALLRIGCSELMVPPKAQVGALLAGLTITAPASVNVVSINKKRQHNQGVNNNVSRLIVGDHVEALQRAMKSKGERLIFPDIIRKREFLKGGRSWK